MRHENVNGAVLGTCSTVKVGTIDVSLGFADAWALCNLLTNSDLDKAGNMLEAPQVEALRRLGRDLGVLIDHPSRDNLGKFKIVVDSAGA